MPQRSSDSNPPELDLPAVKTVRCTLQKLSWEQSMWSETGRLQARGASGTVYDLVEFTYIADDTEATDQTKLVNGQRSYALLDGTVVSVENDGSLVIFETGEELTPV